MRQAITKTVPAMLKGIGKVVGEVMLSMMVAVGLKMQCVPLDV